MGATAQGRRGGVGAVALCDMGGGGGGLRVEHSDRLRMAQQKRLNETKQSNNGRALFSNLSALCASLDSDSVRVWGSGSLGIGSLLLLLLI